MVESKPGFDALIGQLLGAFANMYDWEIKPRLELYLMSILQRGAFLLDMVENPVATFQPEQNLFDPLGTQEAQKFFQEAVQELFEILACDGGLPLGALALGRAIIGKLPTVELQSQFRGHFFFRWFLQDFLRVVIAYPEVNTSHGTVAPLLTVERMKSYCTSSTLVTRHGRICCISFGIVLIPGRGRCSIQRTVSLSIV